MPHLSRFLGGKWKGDWCWEEGAFPWGRCSSLVFRLKPLRDQCLGAFCFSQTVLSSDLKTHCAPLNFPHQYDCSRVTAQCSKELPATLATSPTRTNDLWPFEWHNGSSTQVRPWWLWFHHRPPFFEAQMKPKKSVKPAKCQTWNSLNHRKRWPPIRGFECHHFNGIVRIGQTFFSVAAQDLVWPQPVMSYLYLSDSVKPSNYGSHIQVRSEIHPTTRAKQLLQFFLIEISKGCVFAWIGHGTVDSVV